LCIKLVNYWDKKKVRHGWPVFGQQQIAYTTIQRSRELNHVCYRKYLIRNGNVEAWHTSVRPFSLVHILTLQHNLNEDVRRSALQHYTICRGQLKWDGTHAKTRFRLSAKRMSSFKTASASVQSTAGSRGVRRSGSNGGYTMFRGSVKGTGYPLHSPVSLPLPRVTVCHSISTGVYL